MSFPFSNTIRRWAQPDQLSAGGSYVTDGQRLFRVVTQFPPRDESPIALLEDCHTLELTPFSPNELHDMGLRLVRARAAGP
jgi:hypothetical protein